MSRILIVEDEISIAELEKDYLELSDYEVDIASDGETGESMALKGDYVLCILDVMLPGKDGFEICKAIRKEKNIPIIMVSAKRDDIDKIRGLGLGADDYITKPFSPSELVARVKVFVNNEEKVFPTKAFDLLLFLASNPNKVFSKDELFRNIWDMESIGDIATVTVHIKKIREKIEYDTSKPQYIETIWGVGYRFKV